MLFHCLLLPVCSFVCLFVRLSRAAAVTRGQPHRCYASLPPTTWVSPMFLPHEKVLSLTTLVILLSASLYFSKRGAY